MPKPREQYSLIGSSGELETYTDEFVSVTPEMVAEADEAELRILSERDSIEASFLKLSFWLDDFDNREYYRAKGFGSMRDWAEEGSTNIGWRLALDLMRIAREAIPAIVDSIEPDPLNEEQYGAAFNEAIAMVADAKVSKVRAALPLLTNGHKEEFVDVIERAPDMPWKEVGKEVRRLTNGGEDKEMPIVFVAQLRRGEKKSTFKVYMVDGLSREHCGDLVIPNEHVERWTQRFGKFLEVEA